MVSPKFIQKPFLKEYQCEIASHFNKYFVDIGPTLAKNIPPSTNSFTSYLSKTQYCLKNQTFTSAELETAFFSIEKNKAPGYDDISSNVILNSYSELKDVLFDIFNKSVNSGIFPDALKIAKLHQFLKRGMRPY